MLRENREHIFIVEDNEIYSMMLDYILSKDSVYKFSSFKSGEECLQNLGLNPDVIILDYALPGMNGYDVLLEIKKRNTATHVLMLTNNKDMKLALKLLQAGADDFILKQGNGEIQIIEKIEALLAADEIAIRNIQIAGQKALFRKVAYGLAIASLVVAGVLYFA